MARNQPNDRDDRSGGPTGSNTFGGGDMTRREGEVRPAACNHVSTDRNGVCRDCGERA